MIFQSNPDAIPFGVAAIDFGVPLAVFRLATSCAPLGDGLSP